MNIGYLFALMATFSWAISAFVFTALGSRIPVFYSNLIRLTFSCITLLLLALAVDQQFFLQLFKWQYIEAWLWIGFSGFIAFVVGDDLIFKCYSIIGPKKGSLLTSLSPGLTLLVGIFLLSETINVVGIIGILITIAGTMYISLGRITENGIISITKKQQTKAVWYGIIAASCHGIGIALSKKGIILLADQNVSIQPISAAFIRILFAFIAIALVYFFRVKDKKYLKTIFTQKATNKLLAIGTFFNPTMGVVMSMYSIAYLNVAVAQTFFSLVPLIALLIAFFYYKEKITLRSALGVGFALVGVVVLIWRNDLQGLFG